MVTKQAEPDLDSWKEQERRQRRVARNRKVGAIGLSAALIAGAIVFAVTNLGTGQDGTLPASPAPLMHNGSIGVFGFTGGVRSLTFDGAGKFVFQCQGECTEVRSADWSPDGTRLAFTAGCAGGCGSLGDPYYGVHVVDPVGGTDRLVLRGDHIFPLAWSPDGTHIAYVQSRLRYDTLKPQIFVMNADGSEQTPLTSILGDYPESLSWSPDGSRIAYSTGTPPSGRAVNGPVAEVRVVGIDGSAPSPLVEGSYPTWSPDGSMIAYMVGCEVRMTTPEGGNDFSLIDLTVRPDARGCEWPLDLEWSPDGQRLVAMVFGTRDVSGPTTPGHTAVFVVDADGSNARLFSNWSRSPSPGYHGLTWQPVP
jgi:Tol biopolymer transport system component